MRTCLSIDFDYFVNATPKQRFYLFPDVGREENETLLRHIWMSRYILEETPKAEKLLDVDVDNDRLSFVSELLERQKPKAFMIADSHKHAYNFFRGDGNRFLDIYHIDYHHDTMPILPAGEVDCGNWLRKLYNLKLVHKGFWVKREDSAEDLSLLTLCELEDIPDINFDYIFLCRSGTWTPPHLDTYFINSLVAPLIGTGSFGQIEHNLYVPRYDAEFLTDMETLKASIDRLNILQFTKPKTIE